ncbi:MAG: hypothetical protein IKN54_06515 [Lachnospiraceae bacterium]|nr:hypothetical protein [Lachnospiraceae bacterium]
MVLQSIKKGLVAPYICKNILGTNVNMTTGNLITNVLRMLFYDSASASVSPVSNNQLSSAVYIDVGFGDAPVTENDLTLADGNMDVITGYSASVTHPLEGKKYLTIIGQSNNTLGTGEVKSKTIVYRNDTQNDVTVKEIGMYILYNNLNNASLWVNTMPFILGFRKVLENPITFHPGDVYAITYRIAVDI